MGKQVHSLSFRCQFAGGKDNYTQHYAQIPLKDIPKWIEAYEFTHPNVQSITVKYWPTDKEVEP